MRQGWAVMVAHRPLPPPSSGSLVTPLSHAPLSVNEGMPESKLTLGICLGTWGRQGHVVLAGWSPPAHSREVSLMRVLEGSEPAAFGVRDGGPVALHPTDSEPWHGGCEMGPVSKCSQMPGELCLSHHSVGTFGCPGGEAEAAGMAVVLGCSVCPREQ